MILGKMRSYLWKLKPGFQTYGLIHLLCPTCPELVFRPQTPSSWNFLKFHNFIGFILWFWRKWSPVCENWSHSSGLMAECLLDPSSPNVVSRPQATRSRIFLIFHDFTGFISWFLRKRGPLAKWLSVFLRTKWFWVWVQLQSLHLQISHLLRVWIHSQTRMWHDKNIRSKGVLFVKIGAMVLDLWLDTSYRPKWQKCSF